IGKARPDANEPAVGMDLEQGVHLLVRVGAARPSGIVGRAKQGNRFHVDDFHVCRARKDTTTAKDAKKSPLLYFLAYLASCRLVPSGPGPGGGRRGIQSFASRVGRAATRLHTLIKGFSPAPLHRIRGRAMWSRSRSRFGWLMLALIAFGRPVQAGEKVGEFSFHYDHILGTSLDVWLVAPSAADAEKAEQAILDEIERLRLIFSTYDPKSEISHLNRSSGPTAASAEMIEVLREYESWQRRSAGAFNGQLGELVRTWAAAEKAGDEPSAETLSGIVRTVNRPGWEIDQANQSVTRL